METATHICVYAGTSHPQLASDIADFIGIPLGKVNVTRFPDGEIHVKFGEHVRSADVFIVQPTCTPTNETLMELLIMIDAAKRSSAARITAVLPFYGYARQDRKDQPRVPITAKLVAAGATVEEFDDAVRVRAPHKLHRTHVKTLPYPGYPTDMQPQIAVTLALAEGTSIVTESIFENRFKYADELSRMGANIKVEGNSAIIDGVKKLTGARVSAPDLRAGAALVIAGLAAEGVTVVDDIVYIQRGYENFEEKLRSLGAEIERVSSEKEIQKFRLRVG